MLLYNSTSLAKLCYGYDMTIQGVLKNFMNLLLFEQNCTKFFSIAIFFQALMKFPPDLKLYPFITEVFLIAIDW